MCPLGSVRISGQVVGHSVNPLELYAICDRHNVAYSRIAARADGEPFGMAFLPEGAASEVRVELVCVAECWYATEAPIASAAAE